LTDHQNLTKRIASLYAKLPEVQAVALGGSSGSTHTDAASDIDLYVYTNADVPLEARLEIMEYAGGARRASMGLNFWGPGDEWFDAATGIEVDMVYFDAQWMEDQIKKVVIDHQASMGYSTCFWFTVQHSQVFYDLNGWFEKLQGICQQPYPEPLRQNIIANNHPVLREVIPSYFFQIQKAIKRDDLVSINHRLSALLASYFDILFALNHELHPGEKRLIEKTMASCHKLPENMEMELREVIVSSVSADRSFLKRLTTLLDHLDQLLEQGIICVCRPIFFETVNDFAGSSRPGIGAGRYFNSLIIGDKSEHLANLYKRERITISGRIIGVHSHPKCVSAAGTCQ
jgi:hypothetical protein